MNRFSTSLIPVVAGLVCCLAFANCRKKKNEGPSETRRNIAGSWRVTALGTDMNGNSMLDLDEFVPAPESPALVNTFNEDGSGSSNVSFNGLPIATTNTWELSNSDKTLKMVSAYNGISFTQYYAIRTLSASEMVLADTSRAQHSFTVARKQ